MMSVGSIFAQDIGTTQVKVVEGFKPSIPEATRLNENATFADTIRKDRTQEYAVVVVDLESDYKTRPLKAAKVKADKIPELYATKVSFGFGNLWTTKASVLHNSKRSKTLSYGILLNHFANKYQVSNPSPEGVQLAVARAPYLARNSKNSMHLYGKKMNASHIFMANLSYDRRTASWLEQDHSSPQDGGEVLSRFAYTKFSFSAISKELAPGRLKHYTAFSISDFNELSENQIHLSTNLRKTIKGLPYSLKVQLNDYINYNNPDAKLESAAVQSFHFSPSTTFVKFGVDFNLELELRYFSDETSFKVFPQVKATKELVKDVLLVYGGLRHSEQRHTLKSLSDKNPFIHSYGMNQSVLLGDTILQSLKTTDVNEFYVAMRNVLGKNEVFEGSVAYGKIDNMAHFNRYVIGDYNCFLINYTDLWQLHINANYNRDFNDLISLNINGDYYDRGSAYVANTPNLTFELSVPVSLRDKIKMVPTLAYTGKRVAGDHSLYNNQDFVFLRNKIELPAQIHANLGVYYSYSKRLSAYLQLNNLTNSKQEMWIGYQEAGFNGLFGLNYSF